MKKNILQRNPFLISFVSVATICCIAMSIVYGVIIYMTRTEMKLQKDQEKVQMVVDDLDSQLEVFERIALKIMTSQIYQPYQIKDAPHREMQMLEDFKQYKNYSMLIDDCFLYYGNDKLYFTTGYLKYMFAYVDGWSENEQTQFREVLDELCATKLDAIGDLTVLTFDDNIHFFIPIKVRTTSGNGAAVLCMVVKSSKMAERFQFITADNEGGFALYKDKTLICSNLKETDYSGGSVVMASTADYNVHYYSRGSDEQSGFFPLHILLIVVDIILLFMFAFVIAERNYKPVREIRSKYIDKLTLSEELQDKNSLTEISNMLGALVSENERVNDQIAHSKEILKNQILKRLLEGTYTKEIQIYMQELHMKLPGPCYYVVSISFDGEDSISEALLSEIRNEVEMLSSESDDEYLYALYDTRRNTINIICSVSAKENRDRLVQDIRQVLKNYVMNPIIGAGGIQRTLSRLSASWLESMERLHENQKARGDSKTNEVVFDSSMLKRMLTALDSDNEAAALDYLDQYVAQAKKPSVSVIMRKILFADFVSEINKYSSKTGVDVTSANLSSLLTAANIEDFEIAAKETILNLNAQLKLQRNAAKDSESHAVCQYIREHFSEYDMSLELVAQNLNVSDKLVRAAVQEQTGMMYKDFLICLRMDYAKELLEKERMTVNDVCQKVGYSNVPYFIKVFKKTTGVTPAQYRTQYGKEPGVN